MTALETPAALIARGYPAAEDVADAQTFWADQVAQALLPLGEEDRLNIAMLACLEIGGCWIEPPNAEARQDLFCEFALCGISSGPCGSMVEAVATWIKAVQRRHLERERAA